MSRTIKIACLLLLFAASVASASAQTKRKVIIDQDARGPGSTDQQAILLLIQSPQTDVLGITIVSGDQWREWMVPDWRHERRNSTVGRNRCNCQLNASGIAENESKQHGRRALCVR